MILGMVLFGLLVGTIANALTRASNDASMLYIFRKKILQISRWLENNHIPEVTCKEIQVRANGWSLGADERLALCLLHCLIPQTALRCETISKLFAISTVPPNLCYLADLPLRCVGRQGRIDSGL